MFCVGKFIIVFLSIISLTLVACSIQSVTADHLEPGSGIYTGWNEVMITSVRDSNYVVLLQVILRNGDGQLINVTESSESAAYIPHQITDHVFDTLMGEKEIITIDNIKYEKVQYTYTAALEHRFMGLYPIFSEYYDLEFESTPESREKMAEQQEFSIWKIHYCAIFEGHGYSCAPIFQDLIPTMTLEPSDVVTQQWTILREMN